MDDLKQDFSLMKIHETVYLYFYNLCCLLTWSLRYVLFFLVLDIIPHIQDVLLSREYDVKLRILFDIVGGLCFIIRITTFRIIFDAC